MFVGDGKREEVLGPDLFFWVFLHERSVLIKWKNPDFGT